jgi:amino acid transporter
LPDGRRRHALAFEGCDPDLEGRESPDRTPTRRCEATASPAGADRAGGRVDGEKSTNAMAAEGTGHVAPDRSQGTLGTFGGVFTPSILTILGIILFLRLGFVVGEGGLARALVIILLANTISVLTSFSLAAVATNFTVKGGGDYYLISRTLGREFGGALGIVLYLAQSISIAFYAIGFGEAVAEVGGFAHPASAQVAAAIAVAALFVLAWLGADWATRFQFVIMAILFAAIAAFFVGGFLRWDAGRLAENWVHSGDLPFWALFALFFPAVTGFTQGVSMSGDLKDPGKSLPRGTFLAVGISFVVYLATAVVLAGSAPRSLLLADYGVMRSVAPIAGLVDAGVIAATLSSALASFLGAPRILQSLARDRIFPAFTPFAVGSGAQGNPRRGVLLSGVIAMGGVALGSLNLIAPVVAMFFLISYGLLNYATYYEARAESPSFRPRFRWFDKRLSLVGCLCCLGAMLAIQPAAGIVAVSLLTAIYHTIKRTRTPERWADSSRSAHFQRVRVHLHAMSEELEHPRDWRPVILAFSDDAERRERIIRFASWIEGGSGMTTAVRVIVGEGARARKARAEAAVELRQEIVEKGLTAFPLVVASADPEDAFPAIVQASGLGPIRANTLLLNWFDQERVAEDRPGLRAYGRYLRAALRLDCNVVILEARAAALERLATVPPRDRRIDVWWRDDTTSRLSLLLAYLMSRSDDWKGATIRVLLMAEPDQPRAELLERMRARLEDVRIVATPEVVFAPDAVKVKVESREADLVFLPFALEGEEPVGPFGGPLDDLLHSARLTACVLAVQDPALDAEPDEGKAGELAAALDAAERAEEKARAAEKEATKAAENARKAAKRLARLIEETAGQNEAAARETDAAAADSRTERAVEAELRATEAAKAGEDSPTREPPPEEQERERLARELREAEEEAEKASRRAAKQRVKADDARRESENLGREAVDGEGKV